MLDLPEKHMSRVRIAFGMTTDLNRQQGLRATKGRPKSTSTVVDFYVASYDQCQKHCVLRIMLKVSNCFFASIPIIDYPIQAPQPL
jgi:hypothetical protein